MLEVPVISRFPEMFVAPLNVVVPPTSKEPAIVVFPVLSATINLSVSKVKPPATDKAPDKAAEPATSSVPPTLTLFDKVAELVTSRVLPIVTPPTTDNPVPPTLLNVNVSFISTAAFTSTTPSKVVAPDTFNALSNSTSSEKLASPVTPKVPPIRVFPVLSATLNLSVSIATPPFNDTAPVNTVAPVTFNEPPEIVPVVVNEPPTIASETTDKPVPLVLLNVNVSLISAVLCAVNASVNVVAPATDIVPAKTELPATSSPDVFKLPIFKLPPIVVFPHISTKPDTRRLFCKTASP